MAVQLTRVADRTTTSQHVVLDFLGCGGELDKFGMRLPVVYASVFAPVWRTFLKFRNGTMFG
jgi:hypothetical protein